MEVGNVDFVVVVSARTRNMLNRAFTDARCSAILYDEPKPSDSFTPEGRKRPMLNIGAWEFVPVDARILVVSSDTMSIDMDMDYNHVCGVDVPRLDLSYSVYMVHSRLR